MRGKLSGSLLGVLLLLCISYLARGTTTISGPTLVCVGATQAYTATGHGSGPSYKWSVTPTGSTKVTGTLATSNVTWNATGAYVLKVVVDSLGLPIDSTTLSVTVVSPPSPFISTNFRVACQSYDTAKYGPDPPNKPHILSDTDGCIKVCANTIVKYYANGNLPTDSLTWTVTGGVILSGTNSDSVVVQWGTVNPAGQIMLTDKSLGGCIGSYKICIDIIAKPKASYTVDSATIPVSSYNICFGAKTQFNDLSTVAVGGTISNWYWIFGDGTTSADQNPSHTFPKGTFIVKEVVTNQCGCTDTFSVTLNVSKTPGPHIYVCPRPTIVCQGDTVTYYTDNCGAPGSYHWSWNPLYAHPVAGGPPYTNSSITMMWDSANADGYGTISLGVTCAGSCTGITTLKVPVIQRNPTVTGPVGQTLCTGVPYNFSIPLWPGTRYNWGVIRDSSAVIGGRHSNSVSVQFISPGTYTIHVWYQNALTLCGSDVKFQVTVVSPVTITGRRTICLDSTVANLYTVTGTLPANWSLSGPGGYLYTSSTATFLFPTVTMPGLYTLSASGTAFCAPATAYINVVAAVPVVDFVTGTFRVCFGRPYTYVAHNDIAGDSYQWTVSGGTATKLTGDSITVTWSSAGTLTAQRLNSGGGCPGPLFSRGITQVNLFTDVNLTGLTPACANGTDNYDDAVPDADVTTWSIYPDSLGSVITGNYTSNVNVLWNNIHSTQIADLIVNVTKCGIIVHDTLKVTIHPNPVISVTGPVGAQCRNNLLSFTASLPPSTPYPSSYTWSYGDLSSGTTVPNTTTHAYYPPVSAGTGAVTYTVKVTANGSDPSCPVQGVGITTVQVYPGSFPSISTSVPVTYCGTMPHVTLNSSVANASGTLTYAWYRKFPTTLVSTSSSYTTIAPDSGTYYLVTHDATGCYDTSNIITITNSGPCVSCGRPAMTLTNVCNGKISASTTASSGIHWTVTPGGFTSTSATPTFTFSSPGYYQFNLSATVGACTGDSIAIDSVGLITGLYWDWTCPGAGANYTVNLHDNSLKLPDWHYTGNTWTIQTLPTGPVYSSASANYSQALPPGTYLVTYQVAAAGGSSSQNCFITDTLVVPGKPTFSITEVVSPICEGIPIAFTPVESGTTPAGIRSYSWDFGDGSGSLLANTDRTYTWKSPFVPNHYNVNLTVVDSLGCSYTATSVTDTIYQNTFTHSGTVTGGPVTACDGSTVTLSYTPGLGDPTVTGYLWTDGTTNATNIVAVSGVYNVAVHDLHQCRYVPITPASVTILSPTALLITGARKVCSPNAVVLSDDLGSGYTYAWYRNGVFLVGTSSTLVDNISAGTYTYKLVVTTTFGSTTCHDTSGTVTVVVEPQPAAPVISSVSAISCPLYELAMSVTPVTGFSYTWSNGTHGSIDTITNGGAYRVWVTDTNGCVNYADTLIPYSPASYLSWFPVGCYNLCYQTLPDSLYGPPGSFVWSWLYNGAGIVSGTNTNIKPLGLNNPVFGPGYYQLSLSNIFCTNLSDTLDITMSDCACPKLFGNTAIACDTNAAGYTVTLHIGSVPPAVTSLTFGFDIGPAVPFTVYPPFVSAYTFSFSTLTVPPPATALAKVLYDAGLGHPCMDTVRLNLLPCSWPSEKMTPGDTAQQPINKLQNAATGMVAYPNPANNTVNVNYNFGYESDKDRRIVLYDIMGREVSEQKVSAVTGTVSISLANVAAGAYLVRMTESGNTVHVAHVSVAH